MSSIDYSFSKMESFSFINSPFVDIKKEPINKELEMNIRRLGTALHDVPRNNIEEMKNWIEQSPLLNDDEKRVVRSIATKSRYKEDLLLSNEYLESNIKRGEKESVSKYSERASSYIIEAFMSSNYRGFLKHLICSSIPGYRRDKYKPEVYESDGNVIDSLTGESIKAGEIYYDVISAIGSHDQLSEPSFEALKRADILMKRVWKSDYFYTR